jgi:lipopolysaccharide/colanic/teichoic acid biosynthesis glycosyltransferase
MPEKLKLNLKYIAEKSLWTDLKLIFKTIGKII